MNDYGITAKTVGKPDVQVQIPGDCAEVLVRHLRSLASSGRIGDNTKLAALGRALENALGGTE